MPPGVDQGGAMRDNREQMDVGWVHASPDPAAGAGSPRWSWRSPRLHWRSMGRATDWWVVWMLGIVTVCVVAAGWWWSSGRTPEHVEPRGHRPGDRNQFPWGASWGRAPRSDQHRWLASPNQACC